MSIVRRTFEFIRFESWIWSECSVSVWAAPGEEWLAGRRAGAGATRGDTGQYNLTLNLAPGTRTINMCHPQYPALRPLIGQWGRVLTSDWLIQIQPPHMVTGAWEAGHFIFMWTSDIREWWKCGPKTTSNSFLICPLFEQSLLMSSSRVLESIQMTWTSSSKYPHNHEARKVRNVVSCWLGSFWILLLLSLSKLNYQKAVKMQIRQINFSLKLLLNVRHTKHLHLLPIPHYQQHTTR